MLVSSVADKGVLAWLAIMQLVFSFWCWLAAVVRLPLANRAREKAQKKAEVKVVEVAEVVQGT